MPEISSRKEAKARGLKRYFTGKPCKHGHVCEREHSHGKCIRCLQVKWLRFKEMNPNYSTDYRKRNLENSRAYNRDRGSKYRAAFEALKQLGIEV